MPLFLAQVGISAVMLPIAVVSYIIGFIASWFVTLGGTLTNWALDINSNVLTSITVKTGWIVSRDLANLGFVLAIILIAFITILRYESYDAKKMLVRLISAALLVNFSLVIAGVFIDFSGLMTNFFLSKATSGNISQIGPSLVGSLRAQELFQQKADEATIKNQIEGMGGDFNKFIVFLASQTFISIFTIITAISLISLALMLYIRYIALTLLLILMPLAWLMWIWPDLESYWKQWWKEFMKWSFFAPAVSFFIYLAFQVALSYKNTSGSWVGTPVDGTDSMGLLIKNFGSILGQMVSVLGILYGGLYTAQKMGIAGADIGIKAAGMAKGYITGGAADLGRKYYLGGLNRLSTGLTGKTINQNLQRALSPLTRSPIGGDLAQQAYTGLVNSAETTANEWMKHYDNLPAETRLSDAKNSLDPERRAGALGAMAKKGELESAKTTLGDTKYNEIAKSAVQVGGSGPITKELLKRDANLAAHTITTQSPEFKKLQKDSEFSKYSERELLELAQHDAVINARKKLERDDIKNVKAKDFCANDRAFEDTMSAVRTSWLAAFGEHKDPADKKLVMDKLSERLTHLDKTVKASGSREEKIFNNLKEKLNFIARDSGWTSPVPPELMKFIVSKKKKRGGAIDVDDEIETETENKPTLLDEFGRPNKK